MACEASAQARLPRFDLAGIPQHIVQRGNNRLPCFLDDGDRQRYLQCLYQSLSRFGYRLHTYVLMSNHVHLLLTPNEPGAVSRLMHTFSRNYVGLFNGRHGLTGTLWEGRYKACLVGSGEYFLDCSRYIELNPVRAWMVATPGEHPWLSYHANANGRCNPIMTPHAEHLALAANPTSRASVYRALFEATPPDDLVKEIRCYLQHQRVPGTSVFRSWVEARTGRFAGTRAAGRPSIRRNCP